MASRDALLACTQGIGRIQFDEGSGDVDIIIKKGERAPDKGQVIVPSSLGTVWTADGKFPTQSPADTSVRYCQP